MLFPGAHLASLKGKFVFVKLWFYTQWATVTAWQTNDWMTGKVSIANVNYALNPSPGHWEKEALKKTVARVAMKSQPKHPLWSFSGALRLMRPETKQFKSCLVLQLSFSSLASKTCAFVMLASFERVKFGPGQRMDFLLRFKDTLTEWKIFYNSQLAKLKPKEITWFVSWSERSIWPLKSGWKANFALCKSQSSSNQPLWVGSSII